MKCPVYSYLFLGSGQGHQEPFRGTDKSRQAAAHAETGGSTAAQGG